MPAEPTVWILSRGRKGDLDQMRALAETVGWPFEVKTLCFAGPDIPVLSRWLLRNGEALLSHPLPDLVLCAEASPSVIAREIRRRSGGRTKAVCIGRPAGSAAGFDLVITTAQYRIPAGPNVVELAMPLAATAEASTEPAPADGPIALIIGGPAFPDRLDGAVAQALLADALRHAEARGARLAIHTSPRTPRDVIDTLKRGVAAPHRLHVFGEGENHYRALLRQASEITVTSDSVSMVADALASGRPAAIYPLPQSGGLSWRLGEWLHRGAIAEGRTLFRPARWLFDAGVIEAAADRRKLFTRLVEQRRLCWFGEAPVPPRPEAAAADLATAVAALKRLMT